MLLLKKTHSLQFLLEEKFLVSRFLLLGGNPMVPQFLDTMKGLGVGLLLYDLLAATIF